MIPLDLPEYRRIVAIVERDAGLHLPDEKQYFVASRLQRRLRATGMTGFGAYLSFLGSPTLHASQEIQALVSALTTNVTEVFREAHHFNLLAEHLAAAFVLPRDGSSISPRPAPERASSRYLIWSAGCSTGEEPLSMASVCEAVLGENWASHVRILATDVDASVLVAARDRRDDADLANRLHRLPEGIGSPARVPPADPAKWLRSLHAGITVMQHNLLTELDLPGQFDTIFCRNVTIYFSRETQERVHAMLLDRLAPGGLMALGHSERLLVDDARVAPIGRTAFRLTVPDPDTRSMAFRSCL